jgi:RNA polymerase sigma factor (sigma-70 family)
MGIPCSFVLPRPTQRSLGLLSLNLLGEDTYETRVIFPKNKNKTKSAYWENRPILRSDSIEMMNLPQEVSAEALQQFQDLELTRRSQEGDTEAFGELVTKYRTKIFTMVYGIVRNEHDARDIVQEGFLKAWQSIQRFEGRSSFYTWLYSLMMNAAIYSLRRKGRREEVELDDAIPSFFPGPGLENAPTQTRPHTFVLGEPRTAKTALELPGQPGQATA